MRNTLLGACFPPLYHLCRPIISLFPLFLVHYNESYSLGMSFRNPNDREANDMTLIQLLDSFAPLFPITLIVD